MTSRFLLIRLALAAPLAFALASCGGGGTVPSGGVAIRALPADYATRHAAAYSPFRTSNRDTETVTSAAVLQDLQLLVQGNIKLIRLFDSSDNVSRLTLQAIRDNHLDIKVHLGAYVIAGNDAFNQAEIARAMALANTFSDIVEAVSVGNETMVSWSFNKFTPPQIAAFLTTVRAGITQPVTTDDNWAFWASAPAELLKTVDFVSLHTYSLLDTVSDPTSWDWQQTGVAANLRAAAMMDASIAKAKQDVAAARTYLDGIGYTALPMVIGETGWKAVPTGGETRRAVRHHGHDAPPYQLLVRRWRSRYICGLGEVLRAAWGQPHLGLVLTGVRELRLYTAVLVWWLVLLTFLMLPVPWAVRLWAFSFTAAAPFLLMAWRKRNARKAVFSVVSWCFNAAGLVRGLLAPQRPAREAVGSVQVRNTR